MAFLQFTDMALLMDKVEHLKIPLEKIVLATNNFDEANCIAEDGSGSVYKGQLSWSGSLFTVAAKRLPTASTRGNREFWSEISLLSSYTHKNIISLVGFCDEGMERILVYAYQSRESLDKYLKNPDLTWIQRLKISIGVARGLNYLHDDVGPQHRVVHRDIISEHILLNEDWEPKISGFGLSKVAPTHVEDVTFVKGTFGYLDSENFDTGVITEKLDVYSFGVVLFEILCGRKSIELDRDREHRSLATLARNKFEDKKLDEIIDPNLRKQINLNSLKTFSAIAYQCLNFKRSERPTMASVIEKLEVAFELQISQKPPNIARVGTWGTKSSGDIKNRWSFQVGKDDKLKKITIEHGDVINSLTFISEADGVLHTSRKAGGWNGGDKVSEVIFEDFEEIIGISGTVGLSRGYATGTPLITFKKKKNIISSLSFVTNKRIHGPFGCAIGTPFNVPWDKGSFSGFYGLAGYQIDSIGVFLKPTV